MRFYTRSFLLINLNVAPVDLHSTVFPGYPGWSALCLNEECSKGDPKTRGVWKQRARMTWAITPCTIWPASILANTIIIAPAVRASAIEHILRNLGLVGTYRECVSLYSCFAQSTVYLPCIRASSYNCEAMYILTALDLFQMISNTFDLRQVPEFCQYR